MFDLSKNRFSLVQRTGTPCSAIAFKMRRKSEFLVGMSDYSMKCFDTDSKDLVAWMKGHESAIHSISIHASGRYALTTSADIAMLWDLDLFERKRKLNIKEDVGVSKVFFVPLSNVIVTCFKDDTIFGWESDSLSCKFQLPIPPGKAPHYKSFATTKDGRLLAAAGKSRYIHLWTLDNQKLLRIVELPTKVTTVKQMEFITENFDGGTSQVLGVLCQDGLMRFININTCKLLFDIGTLDNRINSVAVSSTGRYVVGVMENGNINTYNVKVLSEELNKPPAPLVKVVEENKMSDTLSMSTTTAKTITNKLAKKSGAIKPFSKAKRRAEISHDASAADSDPSSGLNYDKLLAILQGYHEYPSKYRMFIWRSILKLPENHAAYGALVDKGVHPAFAKLHEEYPIKSRRLLRILQRILSALAHWSPIFGEMKYLPTLAFPFVKLFQNNHLVCFEIVATIITNWGQHWFEYFPNPPINVLGMIENVLALHDKELLYHFVECRVTSQIYAWPLLETLFSEVLTKDEWLCMWDNVFSNHPSYLLMLVAAYVICSRGPLLQVTDLDDFHYFFHHHNPVDVKLLIKEANRLQDVTPDDCHPQENLDDFKPLTKGLYPVFNKYPKFIVDYQIQERERIRQEELDYMRQRQASLALEQETKQKQQEEEAWYRQQKLLLEAEQKRRTIISDEEDKIKEQRKRLNAMQREFKMKEMKMLDATKRKFVHFQQQQKEVELQRLDDELERKMQVRDCETQEAIEQADLQNMDLLIKKRMLEQQLFREYNDPSQKHEYSSENMTDYSQTATDPTMMTDPVMEDTESSSYGDVPVRPTAVYAETGKSGPGQTSRNPPQPERLFIPTQIPVGRFNMNNEGTVKSKPGSLNVGDNRILNETASDATSAHISFDRGRGVFSGDEMDLLKNVRQLRQKIATENRYKKPPPSFASND